LTFTSSQGQFNVKDFQLFEKDKQKRLIHIPAIALKGIGFNLNDQELIVDSVGVDDATFKASLNQDGVINYQTLFSGPPDTASDPAPIEANAAVSAKKPWIINVYDLAFNKLEIEFEDQSPKKPVTFDISPIDFKISKFSSKSGTKFPFQLSAGINKTGLIKLDGDTVIEPLRLQSAIDIKKIALDKFQPYVDKFAHLDMIDGKFTLNGNATLRMLDDNRLDVKFKGDTGITNLITRDQKLNKDLVKWKKLTLKELAVDLLANRYTATSLVIEKPYARVTIRKDKTVNFADIVVNDKKKSNTPIKSATKPAVGEPKPYFQLGKLQLIDGSSDFADLSLILPFAAPIESLDGGATGMSSDQKSEIKVDLKGNAYDLSPVDIKGEISPQLGNYNIEMNFQGMPMPLISPYMAQFAGYKVEKGKLTLGLKYNIANKLLTASNSIQIDQFELGEKVENPKAVSLPLGLAIALLKDSNGRIKIDVPITGSLEDPKFSVGKLVVDALLNVLTKIITSPFSAIASLMGSEEDLSVVSFAAGETTLDKQQIAKLDSISKALKERPALNLEIKGAAFQEQDWPALQDDALRDQLKKLKAAEVNKKGGRKTRAEHIELSDEVYKQLLAQAFIEKFPTLAEKSLFGTAKLIAPTTGDFYEVAKQKLAAMIKPEPQRLKDLAEERARVIAKYIVQQGGITSDRVFILDSAIDPKRENSDITSALSLKTSG
jgi:outer membrane protein OmpA-like peptidoglycan-associated protein